MPGDAAYEYLDSDEALARVVERYDTFLFDCDGVLWSGTHALPGVASVLEKLRKRGKEILFVTNNASKSRRMLLERIESAGIQGRTDEVFSSAYASALYLKQVLQFPADRKVFVVGMAGLEEELDAVGIAHIGGTSDAQRVHLEGLDFSPLHDAALWDERVGAVLCGIDTDLTYAKMAQAFRYLTRPGAEGAVEAGAVGGGCYFVCTNDDSTFPTKEGFWPGAGAVWAGLREASGRTPTVIGKPHQPMIDTILASRHLDPARALMVGDRLNTDIAFGKKGGLDTLLVLTGVSQRADLDKDDVPAVPTYVAPSLGAFDSVA